MNNSKISLTIYAVSHFAVDFSCFYLLFCMQAKEISLNTLSTLFLLYNVIAFGLQFLIGYWADQSHFSACGIIGLTGVIIALFIPNLWLSVIFSAVANAFFHVGGGIDSLTESQGKISRSGIFVSSGVLGVVLGMLCSQNHWIPRWSILLFCTLCLIMMFYFCPIRESWQTVPTDHWKKPGIPGGIAILLIFISIVIRAYVGSFPNLSNESTDLFRIFTACALFLGKFSGGFFADRFGAKITSVLSLLISLPLLTIFSSYAIAYLFGNFFFQMSMSVALWSVLIQFPKLPGFSFGLTTLALLCGNSFHFFIFVPALERFRLLVVLILISAVALYFAVPYHQKGVTDE